MYVQTMKKEYAEKKKAVKKELKKSMKEDDKKLEDIKKSGRSMIEYLESEKKKLKEKQVAMKAEYIVRT
jgi:dipeptidase